mgnify:CR=1 FL=1
MFTSKTQDGYPINVPMTFKGYKVIKYLGCGSTCAVLLVEQEKTQQLFSAKIMAKKDLENRGLVESTEREINVLKELDHPHIIKVEESFDLQNDDDEYCVIIMEYCANGDLLTYATSQGFKGEQQKKKILYEFLDAIRYLHKKGISHGDIKSENVLLDSHYSAKLCDFGFCRTEMVCGEESKKGTLYYAAPELFSHGDFDPKKTDIWAIGITLYSLFELQFPFKDGNQKYIIKQIMSGRLSMSRGLNSRIREIVEDCTKMSPYERPTIEDIIGSDYFNEIRAVEKICHFARSKNNNQAGSKEQQARVISNPSIKASCH